LGDLSEARTIWTDVMGREERQELRNGCQTNLEQNVSGQYLAAIPSDT
jgi:hypothetical protein